MKDIKEILYIIQARLQSERVPNKMLREFNNSSLFEIAINKVLSSNIIPKNNFYVSVYEEDLRNVALQYDLNIFNRSYDSAMNDNDLKTIYEWHNKLDYKYVIKINGCSPFLKVETIDGFVEKFINQDEENLFGVIETKDYYWDENGRLITNWPKSQTIMNTKAVGKTYRAAHTLYASRMDLINQNKFMGDFQKPGDIVLYAMNELECFDIDYEWEFQLAEKMAHLKIV